ncbi:hypothetical protein WAI453_001508 [Rhynchosporium graminicola]
MTWHFENTRDESEYLQFRYIVPPSFTLPYNFWALPDIEDRIYQISNNNSKLHPSRIHQPKAIVHCRSDVSSYKRPFTRRRCSVLDQSYAIMLQVSCRDDSLDPTTARVTRFIGSYGWVGEYYQNERWNIFTSTAAVDVNEAYHVRLYHCYFLRKTALCHEHFHITTLFATFPETSKMKHSLALLFTETVTSVKSTVIGGVKTFNIS